MEFHFDIHVDERAKFWINLKLMMLLYNIIYTAWNWNPVDSVGFGARSARWLWKIFMHGFWTNLCVMQLQTLVFENWKKVVAFSVRRIWLACWIGWGGTPIQRGALWIPPIENENFWYFLYYLLRYFHVCGLKSLVFNKLFSFLFCT